MAEVDIVIDERLARKADGTGLLGCQPSRDAELWVCYLEKALAIHCGGYRCRDPNPSLCPCSERPAFECLL